MNTTTTWIRLRAAVARARGEAAVIRAKRGTVAELDAARALAMDVGIIAEEVLALGSSDWDTPDPTRVAAALAAMVERDILPSDGNATEAFIAAYRGEV